MRNPSPQSAHPLSWRPTFFLSWRISARVKPRRAPTGYTQSPRTLSLPSWNPKGFNVRHQKGQSYTHRSGAAARRGDRIETYLSQIQWFGRTSSDPTVATCREATRQVNSWKACSPHDGTRQAAQPLRVAGSGYSCVGSSCSASAAGWSRTSCQSPGWLIAASVVTAQPASIVKPRDIATVRAKWITRCRGGIG